MNGEPRREMPFENSASDERTKLRADEDVKKMGRTISSERGLKKRK